MAIVRNKEGFSGVGPDDPWASYDQGDPSKYFVVMEDFIGEDKAIYLADSDEVGGKWDVDIDIELDWDVSWTGPHGVLTLTTEGGDTEGGQFRLGDTQLQLLAGKKAWFQAKFNYTESTIGNVSMFLGLSDNVATTAFIDDLGTALAVDEAWGFVQYDGSATVDFVVRDNDVASGSTDIHTNVSGTEYVYTLYFNGTDSYAYVDKVLVASVVGATHPTSDPMTLMCHFKSQSAEAKVMNLDYMMYVCER